MTPNLKDIKKKSSRWIQNNREKLIEISNKIWEFAELGFEEFKSSELLVNTLKNAGFKVEMGIADINTAFVASYGEGKPVIAILGEYDALPSLSQKAVPYKEPLKEGAPGHGCGHNLLGTGSLGAALAIKEAIDNGEAKGTIRYYGCPAEEIYNAKGYMVEPGGAFKDVDISLTWHPAYFNAVGTMSALAMNSVIFNFYGRTAHAAGDPFNGRSALDAVELMNVGANYMREHIIPDARIHYIITNGGKAPNVVPDEAEVYYFVRAPERYQVEEIYNRLLKVAEGAALMTETKLKVNFLSGTYNPIHNGFISSVLQENMKLVGAPRFNKEEQEFAKEINKTIPPNSMEGYMKFIPENLKEMAKKLFSEPLCPILLPPLGKGQILPGSTDVADVSWVTPLGELATACHTMGSPGHSWQNTATAGMSIGHKGMLAAAKIMALTALDFMNRPEYVEKARKEFEETFKDKKYESPFPRDFKIPFNLLKKRASN
ncbi:MAG: M20 family metallopeptidase [Promethearchaeota archaeon]